MTLIVLAGTIGAGKTSLTKMLADHLGTQPFYESVDDNEVLPLYYENPNQYAFLLQIYFLNNRFASIKQAYQQDNNVLDRSIFEDSLIFHLNADLGRATETEVRVYDTLLANMMEELPYAAYKKHPDLLIHIKVSFDTMLKRIKLRNRPYEQIEHDPNLYAYYQEMNRRYEQWFKNYHESPKMQIDGDQWDFVTDPDSREHVIQMVDDRIAALAKN